MEYSYFDNMQEYPYDNRPLCYETYPYSMYPYLIQPEPVSFYQQPRRGSADSLCSTWSDDSSDSESPLEDLTREIYKTYKSIEKEWEGK